MPHLRFEAMECVEQRFGSCIEWKLFNFHKFWKRTDLRQSILVAALLLWLKSKCYTPLSGSTWKECLHLIESHEKQLSKVASGSFQNVLCTPEKWVAVFQEVFWTQIHIERSVLVWTIFTSFGHACLHCQWISLMSVHIIVSLYWSMYYYQ